MVVAALAAVVVARVVGLVAAMAEVGRVAVRCAVGPARGAAAGI